MHERRLDERRARRARGALVRPGPLARDAVDDVRAGDRRRHALGSDERDRERSLDERCGARDEPEREAVIGQGHVASRRVVDAVGDPRPPRRGPEPDERDDVPPVAQRRSEGAGLRFGSADGGEELLRDDHAHSA